MKERESFQCEKCSKTFNTKGYLSKHTQRVHDELRDHVCQECLTGFFSKFDLKVHENRRLSYKISLPRRPINRSTLRLILFTKSYSLRISL